MFALACAGAFCHAARGALGEGGGGRATGDQGDRCVCGGKYVRATPDSDTAPDVTQLHICGDRHTGRRGKCATNKAIANAPHKDALRLYARAALGRFFEEETDSHWPT